MNKLLKIIIVIIICLIVVLSAALIFSQCSNDNPDPTTTTTTTTTTSGTPKPDPECTEHVDANTDYLCDNCGEPLEKPDDGFTATNDKVYVITTELNVRKTPDTNGNPVGSVVMDTELTRLGYYDNGWSKIIYDGEECYVDTNSITTSRPIMNADFTVVDETVYFTQNTIAWTKPSYVEGYSEKIDTFFKGESVKRTGVANVVFVDTDGTEYTFAKIEYTVKIEGVPTTVVRYVNNAYLTTEAPNTDGDVVFEANDNILVSKSESFWLRKSTVYEDSEKALKISQGTVLQAIARGVESDGTIWYKVVYNDEVYYAIYKESYFDKVFENLLGEFNIYLPETFFLYNQAEQECTITDGTTSIVIANTGALPAGTTAQYFADAMIDTMQLENVEVKANNGTVYFEFETIVTVENQTVTTYCLVTFTSGSNNSFYITTIASEGTKADLSETFWGYVDTITLTPNA